MCTCTGYTLTHQFTMHNQACTSDLEQILKNAQCPQTHTAYKHMVLLKHNGHFKEK